MARSSCSSVIPEAVAASISVPCKGLAYKRQPQLCKRNGKIVNEGRHWPWRADGVHGLEWLMLGIAVERARGVLLPAACHRTPRGGYADHAGWIQARARSTGPGSPARPPNPLSMMRSRPGRVSLLVGCLIHEAARRWSHVRWSHLAAGAGKANVDSTVNVLVNQLAAAADAPCDVR